MKRHHVLVSFFFCGALFAQTSSPANNASRERPLPDLPTLFRDITKHQKELDDIRKNYIFRESSTEEELDASGNVKKTTFEEKETFYVGRRSVSRVLSKDGKQLTPSEQAKEQERVDKEVEGLRKKQLKQESSGKQDDDEIGVETFLKVAKLTNERREMHNGRKAVVCDFSGDPDMKTHGIEENAFKKLSGTIWIDETHRQIMRMEAHFDDSFKVGGGLLASLQKGSKFAFEQAFINNEVWLPTYVEANISARILLFKAVREHTISNFSDYRKFRSTSKITIADPGEKKPDH